MTPGAPQQGDGAGTRRRLWPWLLGAAAALGITGGLAIVVVAVVVMVFVVVVLVGLALLAVFVLAFIVSGPVSHGPGFVDALAANDDRGAYNLLCERTASRVTFDDFVARYAPAKPVASVSKVTSGGSFSDPPDKVEATFTFTDGTTRTLAYVAEAGPDGNLYVCDPPTFQR